jgi:hypothetical protein
MVVILDKGVLTLVTKPKSEQGSGTVLAFEGVHQSAEGAYLGVAAREHGAGTERVGLRPNGRDRASVCLRMICEVSAANGTPRHKSPVRAEL